MADKKEFRKDWYLRPRRTCAPLCDLWGTNACSDSVFLDSNVSILNFLNFWKGFSCYNWSFCGLFFLDWVFLEFLDSVICNLAFLNFRKELGPLGLGLLGLGLLGLGLLGLDLLVLGLLELFYLNLVFLNFVSLYLVSLEKASSKSVFLDLVLSNSAFSNTSKVVSTKTHERVQTCQLIKPNLTSEALPL